MLQARAPQTPSGGCRRRPHQVAHRDVFVRANKTKGILPEILEELLGARKRAKADLKKAQAPLEKADGWTRVASWR